MFGSRQKKSNIEEVIVATSDQEIADVISKQGGKSIITNNNHTNGSDRIFEAVENLNLKPDVIINVQGDMPLINPDAINYLFNFMKTESAGMATLASHLEKQDEVNPNVVKVETKNEISTGNFSLAKDIFLRKKMKELIIFIIMLVFMLTNTPS